jgi:sRNA-binding carbon storage regulator CsrA
MLHLTRRQGDSIRIGPDIRVVIDHWDSRVKTAWLRISGLPDIHDDGLWELYYSEATEIAPGISLTVHRSKVGGIQVGVDAPRDVLILRGELEEKR